MCGLYHYGYNLPFYGYRRTHLWIRWTQPLALTNTTDAIGGRILRIHANRVSLICYSVWKSGGSAFLLGLFLIMLADEVIEDCQSLFRGDAAQVGEEDGAVDTVHRVLLVDFRLHAVVERQVE